MAPLLYTIETNVSFPAETVDTPLVCAVAAEFGVPRALSVTQIVKRNVASKLYRVEAVPVSLMLRAIPNDFGVRSSANARLQQACRSRIS